MASWNLCRTHCNRRMSKQQELAVVFYAPAISELLRTRAIWGAETIFHQRTNEWSPWSVRRNTRPGFARCVPRQEMDGGEKSAWKRSFAVTFQLMCAIIFRAQPRNLWRGIKQLPVVFASVQHLRQQLFILSVAIDWLLEENSNENYFVGRKTHLLMRLLTFSKQT